MKKIIIAVFAVLVIILCAIIFSIYSLNNAINVSNEDAKNTLVMNNIISSGLNDSEFVTRGEFITALSKTIGATDDTHNYYAFNIDRDVAFYEDEYDNIEQAGYIILTSYDFCCNSDNNDYINDSKISYGYSFTNDLSKTQFLPDNIITTKEAITFMTRCLEKTSHGTTKSFLSAYKWGLINMNDDFFSVLGKKELKNKDMYILLYRLLNSKRYKYFDYMFMPENILADPPWWSGYIDYERSMTYLDYLNSRQLIEKDR